MYIIQIFNLISGQLCNWFLLQNASYLRICILRDSLTRFFASGLFINRLILVPLEMSYGRFNFHLFIELLDF